MNDVDTLVRQYLQDCTPAEMTLRELSPGQRSQTDGRPRAQPVLRIERIADAPPRAWAPWPTGQQGALPLDGLRVLDLTRILAGPVGLREGDPTFTKMEKLGRYLRGQLKGSGGAGPWRAVSIT